MTINPILSRGGQNYTQSFSSILILKSVYFAELWDVGGGHSHRNSRHVFYSNFHGIILVHDLANRKSQQNLEKWLREVIER